MGGIFQGTARDAAFGRFQTLWVIGAMERSEIVLTAKFPSKGQSIEGRRGSVSGWFMEYERHFCILIFRFSS